jgi:hypothetical protein
MKGSERRRGPSDEASLPLPRSTRDIEEVARRVVGPVEMLPPEVWGTLATGVAGFARQLWWERRLRTRYFPADLFAEPAWDILLYLYASEAEGESVTVGSACRAASVPSTTGLRFLNSMVERRFLSRVTPGRGGRATSIELAPAARLKMAKLLGEIYSGRRARDRAGEARGRDGPPPG